MTQGKSRSQDLPIRHVPFFFQKCTVHSQQWPFRSSGRLRSLIWSGMMLVAAASTWPGTVCPFLKLGPTTHVMPFISNQETQTWVCLNCPLEGLPLPPIALEDPSLKPQPFPPHRPPPSSPHPLALVAMLRERGAQAGAWKGSKGGWGWRERSLQAALLDRNHYENNSKT